MSLVVDLGKATDWISAIADFVMACVAIIGIIFAGKWKIDATKDKVIDRGIKILSIHLPEINNIYCPPMQITVIKSWLESLTKKNITEYSKIHSMKPIAIDYNHFIQRQDDIYANFTSDLEHIKILSWDVNKEYKAAINEIQTLMQSIKTDEFVLFSYISIILSYWNLGISDATEKKAYIGVVWNLSNDQKVHNALDLTNKIMQKKKELSVAVKTLSDKKLDVFSFIKQVK